MKIYDTTKDEYGLVRGNYEYLCDRGVSRSGTKGELLFEMRVWNFIARIVNKLKLLNK